MADEEYTLVIDVPRRGTGNWDWRDKLVIKDKECKIPCKLCKYPDVKFGCTRTTRMIYKAIEKYKEFELVEDI